MIENKASNAIKRSRQKINIIQNQRYDEFKEKKLQ